MKILITGASGYIASALIQRLLKQGKNEIYTLDLHPPLKEIRGKVTHINADLSVDSGLRDKLENVKFDIVVHLAAKTTGEPYKIMKTNVIGTGNLLESLSKRDLRLILVASTAAQLYRNAQYTPIDEKHPVTPVTAYGLSKHLMEETVNYYYRVYELPTLIFRQTNVYGPAPNQKFTVINKFIEEGIGKGEITIYGDGKQVRNFIYMEDLIEHYVKAIFHSKPKILAGETINVAGPEEYQIRELAKIVVDAIFRETGTRVKIRYTSPSIPPHHEVYLFKISPEKAQKLLDYRSKTTVKEGINKLLKSYK